MVTRSGSALSILRKIGFAEGFSWLLLLFIAMPLKYLAGEPMPVRIVGWIHGLLFITYLFQLAVVHYIYKWGTKKTVYGIIASFLPFGTWIFDKQLKRIEQAGRTIS
jgi:integral membrane protein